MALSPDELALLYAGYDHERLEQAVSDGPLQFTREAWIAICAECEKRGIAWDRPPAPPALPASATAPVAPAAAAVRVGGVARKKCREAAIACGIPVAVGAIIAGYLIIDDWSSIRGDSQIVAIVGLVFGFLFLVVKKMWDGSAVALWAMGSLLAIVILLAIEDLRYLFVSQQMFRDAWFVVPVVLELLVLRALMAQREERKAGTA
jgi:hypothetical protein